MKDFKSHFRFNKRARSGIFFLLLIILFLQVGFVLLSAFPTAKPMRAFSEDIRVQAKIDVLKEKALHKDSVKVYSFNPNFINDHKGYTLGMSIDEINRLHAFRKQNQYVNSPEEFQKVTLVSDSLLAIISPYFRFPQWTENINHNSVTGNKLAKKPERQQNSITIRDLNKATVTDLKSVNGIGDKLSQRIVKFRNRLGGFLIDEQLFDVYGLDPYVAKTALKSFRVIEKPDIRKININMASVEEMVQLVYIRYEVAHRIVEYRNINGGIVSLDELTKIEDFPSDKIDRIKLYLTL